MFGADECFGVVGRGSRKWLFCSGYEGARGVISVLEGV